MQLKRIQLNGFKSFVDPTSIPVLSHMNAVVGPNGCGKSNIVDAIRWVTGETSAKQLRGQSMSDVIFNGTSGRKPVGKASVELTFDNSDRRIAGEYAAFSEISIRREVVRDGQSSYFINGIPARRRDLVDLFLGTGLGPRSYAIIEQGMIAQLVEAKPEELRSHFEEVAGISKYRERRRETENRIRHTQDNLDRLNDLRDELEKQLRHLQRQSEAAEKYKVMQQELRLLHAQMKALQWKQYESQLNDKKETITAQATEYEAKVATVREHETVIEKSRLASEALLDQKNDIQKTFYNVGAEIARLEQQIQHKQEQSKQWQRELTQSDAGFLELSTQLSTHADQIQILLTEIDSLKPQENQLHNTWQAASRVLMDAEHCMKTCAGNWDQFQGKMSFTNQQLEVAKNNISHGESQKKQLMDRHAHMQTQLSVHSLTHLSDELSPLTLQADELKKSIAQIQETLSQLSQSIQHQRAVYQESQTTASTGQGMLQKLEAQHASLSALQQSVLQDHHVDVRPWLEKQGLKNAVQLGKTLQVETGWEVAVETVLGNYFDAICVDSIDTVAPALSQLSKGQVTLLQAGSITKARLAHKTVSDVVGDCENLPAWLFGIYIADDLSQAITLKTQLNATESVVTREGYWLGSNWIRANQSDTSTESFLMREKDLKQLHISIQTQKEKLLELQAEHGLAKTGLEQLESSRDVQHKQFQEKTTALTELQANLSAKKSRFDTLTQQQQRLLSDSQQIVEQLKQCESTLLAAHDAVGEYTKEQAYQVTERESLLKARSAAESDLSLARADAQTKKQQADEWRIKLTSSEKQLALLQQTLQANEKQLQQMTDRRDTLTQQLSQVDAPLKEWADALQSSLSQRMQVESDLRVIDTALQTEQHQLKNAESMRDVLSKSLLALQEHQQQLKMHQQEITVRQATLQEQLSEMQFELNTVLSGMENEADFSEFEIKARKLQDKIDRLGPINLAAIDEFKTLSERKVYMDSQVTDLTEALDILQNAIRKIDRETRHLFKDTFDQVNHNFQQLFPKIFGGGQASLMLTDDDLLTTGIIVKAQPPGKRNATIHMLSGGEKTLTAISLMFAMFHINPAPFCVLDEVDAPLDDLNVGRFCQLVKEMSKDTQFLIISHNKVTIEIADHLMGVTMQEPGVSRIVSVDIQEAVRMVE